MSTHRSRDRRPRVGSRTDPIAAIVLFAMFILSLVVQDPEEPSVEAGTRSDGSR